MSLVWILKGLMSVFINASGCCQKLNQNALSLSKFWKRGIVMKWEETIYSSAISQLTFRVSNIYTSPFTVNTIHWRIHWISTDKRLSLKRKENWRKLLLGSQTGDKLRPNHCSFLFLLGFAITGPRGAVSCRDFLLRPVATFLVMLLVGIYPGRAFD